MSTAMLQCEAHAAANGPALRSPRLLLDRSSDASLISNGSSRCSGSTPPRTTRSAGSPTSPSARRRSTRGSKRRGRRSPPRRSGSPRTRPRAAAIEKDVALHQGRLSKFREQAMAVKTNQEYHAIQHEIDVRADRDQDARGHVLERMLRGRRAHRRGEARRSAQLAAEQKAVDAETQGDGGRARRAAARRSSELAAERAALVGRDRPAACSHMFEQVAQARTASPSPKRATASAPSATCGCGRRCSTPCCATTRSCSAISCNRILYYVPAPPRPRRTPSPQPAQ